MSQQNNHGAGDFPDEGHDGQGANEQIQDGYVMLDQPEQDGAPQEQNPTQATDAAKPQFGPQAQKVLANQVPAIERVTSASNARIPQNFTNHV